MSGVYSIDPIGTGTRNFKTFTDAIASLRSQGINNSVTFEVADGTYNESLDLTKNINGLGGSRMVTFIGKSQDSSKVTITNSSQYLVEIERSNFKFEYLGFESTHNSGRVFLITNANDISISNCLFDFKSKTTNTYSLFITESSNISIEHNNFKSGYNHVFVNSFSTSTKALSINYNICQKPQNYFAYLRGVDGFEIIGNQVGGKYPHPQGRLIETASSGDGVISKNRLVGGIYAISMTNANSGFAFHQDSIQIVNNFINSKYNLGINILNSNKVNLYHNTIIARNQESAINYRKCLEYSIVNNLIVADSCDYGLYIERDSTVAHRLFDYNAYSFSQNTNYCYYNGNKNDFQELLAADTLSNLYSIDTAVSFNIVNDSIVGNHLLNNRGKLLQFSDDIYSNKRPFAGDTAVDIGCVEFKLDSLSLSISKLNSPTSLKIGSNKISCEVFNNGSYPIAQKNLRIGYSTDGTTWYYDSLKINSLAAGASINHTFKNTFTASSANSALIQIKIDDWPSITSNVNGSSAQFDLCLGISGNYSVGKSGDYKTISQAIAALECGVSGPVVFELENDTFKESFSIGKIPGVSAINTISFTSKNSNALKTVIASSDFNTITLASAAHIVFKEITIVSQFGSNLAHSTVFITGDSKHNSFTNCIIKGSEQNNATAIHINVADSNSIDSCTILGAITSIYLYGNGNANPAIGNSFRYNSISDYENTAFEALDILNTIFEFNNVGVPTNKYPAGYKTINIHNSNHLLFNANTINTTGYAFYLYRRFNTNPGLNNTVTNNLFKSSGYYGLYLYHEDSLNFSHNTFIYDGAYRASLFAIINNGVITNNIFKVINADHGLEFGTLTNSSFNYNNIKTENANLPLIYNRSIFENQDQLKANGINTNGLSLNPLFVNNIPTNGGLKGKGLLGNIITDIDNKPRIGLNDSSVDVGCHEFTAAKHALYIKKLISPVSVNPDSNSITLLIENIGYDSILNAQILVKYSIDAGSSYIEDTLRISALASGQSTKFTFRQKWYPTKNGSFILKTAIDKALSQHNIKASEKDWYICTGLSGTYTIGANGNYKNLNQAIKALECGISGPVTFLVDSGKYSQKVVIGDVIGTSKSNTITFKGFGKATIEYHGNSTTDRFGFQLRNAKHVIVDGFNFTGVGANASGLLISEKSKYNIVKNCYFDFPAYNSIKTNVGLGIQALSSTSTSSYSGSYNLIDSCEFNGAYYGVEIDGNFIFGAKSNKVSNSVFIGQDEAAIHLDYCDSSFVNNNSIGDSLGYIDNGIHANNARDITVFNNRIFAHIGIDHERCIGGEIFNNQLICSGNAYSGVYTPNVTFAHNSCLSNGFMHNYGSDSFTMINNQFFSNSTGYFFNLTNTTFKAFDFNNIYTPNINSYFSRINTTFQLSTAEFIKALSISNNQIYTVDPKFVSGNDLHLKSNAPGLAGKYFGINEDFDGDARCRITPMIGMDEGAGISSIPSVNFTVPDTVSINYELKVLNKSKSTNDALIFWLVNDTLISNSTHLKFSPKHFSWHYITLIHKSCAASDTVTDSFIVLKAYRPPIANFGLLRNVFTPDETINLFDSSLHFPDSFKWSIKPLMSVNNFGYFDRTHYWDAKQDSFTQNPKVNIYYTGKYDVCLRVENKLGADSICKKDIIEIREHSYMCTNSEGYEKFGRLTDRLGPNLPYRPNENCNFIIKPCSGPVVLKFQEFNLDKSDYLRLYADKNNKQPLWDINKYPFGLTGDLTDADFPKRLTSKTGVVFIHFRSDSDPNTVGDGFMIDWDSKDSTLLMPTVSVLVPDTVCQKADFFAIAVTENTDNLDWDLYNDGKIDATGFTTKKFKSGTSNPFELKVTAQGYCGQDTSEIVTINNFNSTNRPGFRVTKCFVEQGQSFNALLTSTGCQTNGEWYIKNYGGWYTYWNLNATPNSPGFYDLGYIVKPPVSPINDTILKRNSIYCGSYCELKGNNGNNYSITNFSLANIKRSSKANESYNFNSNEALELKAGETYTFKFEFSSNDAKNIRVYLDASGDYNFDEKGELLLQRNRYENTELNAQITIPNFTVRDRTRLRVVVYKPGQKLPQCGTINNGEVEDYVVEIENPYSSDFEFRFIGNPVDTVNIGSSNYVDSGVICLHRVEGNLTSKVRTTGFVDTKNRGTYYLTYNVQDRFANRYQALRMVVVKDIEPPVLTLIDKDYIYTDINMPFVDPGYTVSDNTDPNVKVEIQGKVDTSTFGEYILKYIAIDKDGNRTVVKRTVSVSDYIRPTISLVGPDTVFVEVYDSFYVDSGYVYDDNDSANVSIEVAGSWTGVADKFQTYSLKYIAEDRRANKASATRTIIAIDTTAPTIELIDSNVIEVERWSNYVDAGYMVSDNFFSDFELKIDTLGNFVNTQSVGEYSISYRATDPEGNRSNMVERTIKVVQPNSIDNAKTNGIAIYPNPARKQIIIKAKSAKGRYSIIDIYGKEVGNGLIANEKQAISIAKLSAGVYFIKIDDVMLRFVKVE
jgi:hypothetical protein